MVRHFKGYDTRTGKKVEVAFDDENPHKVWFPATVLKHSHKGTFQVEYQQPGSGGEAVLHKATVDSWQIRPSPPHMRDRDFGLDDEVDAYYDYGWWCGVITQELPDNRYNVFFEHSNKEKKFISSKLRPHIEWEDGKWYSEGDTIFQDNIPCNLINKQTELTTPNKGTQSTVATSIMKPVVDSYDNSPLSKKRKNGTSAGQSEGLDSEFDKTENLSHGKKVHCTGKGIKKCSGAMDSSKENGKAAKKKTTSNLDEGAKDDSGKTKAQESVEKDATNDLAGLQYDEMTVSQEKITKKSSTDLFVSVAEGNTEQLDAPSEQSTVVDKEVHEDNAPAVASKRKRRRPVRLQVKSPETLLTASHENGGVDLSAASVVESSQLKEVSSPKSSGTKSLEKDQEPLKQDKLLNESQEQDLKANLSRNKYSSRGKRGKRQTISINAEAPVQVSQDASKETADENMDSRKTDASAGKQLDIVSDDQPLSRWIDGMHSPIPIHSPASENRLEVVTCDTNAENLLFVKRFPLWHTIEAMEAFQKIPQNPHFRPLLEGVKESTREGLAIGTMVTFSTVVDRTSCLRFDDPRTAIEDALDTLVDLESNGFDVEVIRDRLTHLLLLKDKQEELEDGSKGVVEKLEEQKEKTSDDEVNEIDRQIRQLEETRRKVLLKKEEWNLEVDAMKAADEAIEQKIMEDAAEFDRLAAAPFVS